MENPISADYVNLLNYFRAKTYVQYNTICFQEDSLKMVKINPDTAAVQQTQENKFYTDDLMGLRTGYFGMSPLNEDRITDKSRASNYMINTIDHTKMYSLCSMVHMGVRAVFDKLKTLCPIPTPTPDIYPKSCINGCKCPPNPNIAMINEGVQIIFKCIVCTKNNNLIIKDTISAKKIVHADVLPLIQYYEAKCSKCGYYGKSWNSKTISGSFEFVCFKCSSLNEIENKFKNDLLVDTNKKCPKMKHSLPNGTFCFRCYVEES